MYSFPLQVSEKNEGDAKPIGVVVSGHKGLEHTAAAQATNRTQAVTTGENIKGYLSVITLCVLIYTSVLGKFIIILLYIHTV